MPGGGVLETAGTAGAAGTSACSGEAPVSIHWTSAAGSGVWPSRGSRRTYSKRSLPKRITDTA